MQGRLTAMALGPALALMLAATAAEAVPSQKEISDARGRCHANKVRVHAMEQRLGAEAPEIDNHRRTWEQSCAEAQTLMDLAAGRPVLRAEVPAGYERRAEFARLESEPEAKPLMCE